DKSRDAFDDEGHLPSNSSDEVPRRSGHPQYGYGIAEQKECIGTGALGAGKPVGQQNEHRWKDEAFCYPKEKPVECEQPEVADDAGKRSQDSPTDQRGKDQPPGAPAPCVGCAWNLKEKVAEEEESAKKSRARVADVERAGQSGCSAEAIVRAIEISEAIGDKDGGQNVKPAPSHLGSHPACIQFGFCNRILAEVIHNLKLVK